MSKRVMPVQKPGRSKQDFATPRDFLTAVEKRFGPIAFDLAAHKRNARHPLFFTEKDNSLAQDWSKLPGGNLWLNPPFGLIDPWAAKCAETVLRSDQLISFLTPASVGADWFVHHVWPNAYVLPLQGRLCFDGVDLYPKDCMLSVFGLGITGFEPWDWRAWMTDEGRALHKKQKRKSARLRAERKAAA